jgi:hypothetical protein
LQAGAGSQPGLLLMTAMLARIRVHMHSCLSRTIVRGFTTCCPLACPALRTQTHKVVV